MKKIALIPAYEPGEILLELAQDLKCRNYEVVIVDDGSGRDFSDIFNRAKAYATVLQYNKNQGKGCALKTGLRYIKKYYKKYIVVTMDSDGQHLVSDADKLVAAVEKNDNYFLIGSRVLPKDAPIKSRIGNSITRWVFKHISGGSVYDTQSGLRAFSYRMTEQMLEIEGCRYEYEMNVLLYLAKNKIPTKEVPIKTIYFDKRNSVSHFNAFTDSIRIYRQIFKFAGSSFLSFLIDYGMYALLLFLLGTKASFIVAANFGARAVSSVFNFTLNKRFVFKSNGNIWLEAAKYFGLVLFVIAINSVILTFLTKLGLNALIAKVFVEMIMFIFNYFVQHHFIFRKEPRCEKVYIQ